MAPLTRKRKAVNDAAPIQQKKPARKGKAVVDFRDNDVTYTKQVDRENVKPAKVNPLTLGKDKDTQNTNQLGKENLVHNDAHTIIDANVDKCNTCSQLEVQAKSDVELNRVRQTGAESLPLKGDHTETVWVELEKKNIEGLVRWYPVCGARVGVAVIVNSEGVIESWRTFVEDDDGEQAGKPFQVQVASTLAHCTRYGRVELGMLPKELNGIVACKHFEDIQPILEKELKSTNYLMDLLASRR